MSPKSRLRYLIAETMEKMHSTPMGMAVRKAADCTADRGASAKRKPSGVAIMTPASSRRYMRLGSSPSLSRLAVVAAMVKVTES